MGCLVVKPVVDNVFGGLRKNRFMVSGARKQGAEPIPSIKTVTRDVTVVLRDSLGPWAHADAKISFMCHLQPEIHGPKVDQKRGPKHPFIADIL